MRLRLRWSRRWLGLVLLLGAAQGAAALQVSSLSPQSEVAQVRQVVARFDAPAVNFGDAKSAAPLLVTCNDAQAAQGHGRWSTAQACAHPAARPTRWSGGLITACASRLPPTSVVSVRTFRRVVCR